MDTEALGRKALTDALRKSAGLKSAYASQLVSGDRTPGLDVALMIEETTGIPPTFWRDHVRDRPAAMWARVQQETAK